MIRFNLNRDITATAELGIFDISNEVSCRFVIENAGVTNEIEVSGRITGQNDFTLLGTLTGSINEVISVETYDDIKVECTVYSSSGNLVKVLACSFDR